MLIVREKEEQEGNLSEWRIQQGTTLILIKRYPGYSCTNKLVQMLPMYIIFYGNNQDPDSQ